MKKNSCLSIIFLTLFFLCSPLFAASIDKIISFGDSLSDNGNVYTLTSSLHKATMLSPVVPKSPPYYQGRFTNGPVWVDNLAVALNVPLENHAYAGSWAEGFFDSGQLIPFSLGMQVNFYWVGSVLDFNKERHLYTIWSGANDYIGTRSDQEYATTNTVNVIKNQIEALISMGAKNFLVFNLPDIGKVPEAVQAGPDYSQALTQLVLAHNEKLKRALDEVQKENPDVKIMPIDMMSYFNEIISNSGGTLKNNSKYHLKNVHDACYGGNYYMYMRHGLTAPQEIATAKKDKLDIMNNPVLRVAYINGKLAEMGRSACSNPDDYMFWDFIHPTKIVHASIADIVLKKLFEADLGSDA